MKHSNISTSVLAALAIVIISLPVFAGGPWTQKKGSGYFQAAYTFIPKYHSLYSSTATDNTLNLKREVSDVTLSGYLEYGLTERLTLISELPYKITETHPEVFNTRDFGDNVLAAGTLNGLGNISLGVLHPLIGGNFQLSGRFKLETNVHDSDAATGLRSGIDAWGLYPAIILGKSFEKSYIFADAGVRFRTNNYSNELLLQGEAGRSLFDRLWVIGVLDIRQSLNDGTANNENSEQTGLYPDNQEYFAFGIKFIFSISERVGVNISGFGASSGNLVAKSPANTLGIYYRW